jgi:TRAP-type C4-dicarboxylate transport system substrate-binding protein
MRQMGRSVVAAATVVVALTMVTGCSGAVPTDKAGGGGGVQTRVLKFAQPNHGNPPSQLVAWARAVEVQSGGTVRIEFTDGWRNGEATYESGTIDDVKAGKVDGAWVGARVFDTIGVNSFQALLAPLLVDSQDLQSKVFEAGIPDQMMAGLDKVDLAGIGVLPGPMRKILGVAKPYLAPEDFKGSIVGIQASGVATKTFSTLGATVRAVPGRDRSLQGLDAYEQQLSAIASNQFAASAKYVTGNINFWPRPLVLFTSHRVADSLTPEQLSALRETAKSVVPAALDASRIEDERGARPLCNAGMKLPAASEGNLAALRSALQPVYEELSADPETATQIAAIEKLKTELANAPDLAACKEAGTTKPKNDLAGEYRWTLTREDTKDRSEWSGLPSTFTAKLADGRWVLTQSAGPEVDSGDYKVFRDRIILDWDTSAPTLSFSYTADSHGNLTLRPIQPMEAGDAFVMSTKQWIRQ